MKGLLLLMLGSICLFPAKAQNTFTVGNLIVLQTSGTSSKASSAVTLKEYSTSGVAGMSVTLPTTGPTPFQSAGIYGGSEGFLTTSSDGKYLALAGYATPATIADITASSSVSVTRAVGLVYPSGFYLQTDTSNTFFSLNDIRGAVSDGTNFWASGASNALIDGIDYFGPGPRVGLAAGATPPKAYGMRIFNGQLYFSTQKAGPTNTSSQLGIFALGTGTPTSGVQTVTQIINTGTVIPQDFSFNPAGDICYIAVNLNTAAGGIQKWTKTASVWTLAYTLGTGTANVGAYGLVADYSGPSPVIYATTFESAGNRVIKITDIGSSSAATTLVAATANTFYKGITFAPVVSGLPVVNLSVNRDTASEAGVSVITVTANASAAVTGNQTVALAVSGTGITAGDYTLSNTTITIPAGATSGSVTFTVNNDILGEGTEVATLAISGPTSGILLDRRTTQRVTITDNDGNNRPTVALHISTTNFIDAGISVAPLSPFKMSGVVNDPTDPAATLGVNFLVGDLETAASALTAWAISSNTTVVPAANITLAGTDTMRTVKITPLAVGYSNITVKVTDGIDTASYVLNYAASDASATPANTVWHTGMSDASDGVAIDDNYFISADDELNILNVYSRTASGMPLKSYDYTTNLSLPDLAKPEVDIEASAVSASNPNKVYWLGSMSNGKAPFDAKPNRDRIFATTYTGTGSSTSFSFAGYTALKSAILAWGDSYGYNFTASAAVGVDSKLPGGFAAEGMVFGPDNSTLYIGLRAPLVPTANRTKAVVVPILNFEAWFNNGTPSGGATFGAPIELALGGRGIRDITRLTNGSYVIVAGNPGGAPLTSAIYKWTGKAGDAPIMVTSSVSGTLNLEGVMQINTSGNLSLTSLQVITDQGDDVLYNDGNAAKDFGDLIYRKFRSDIVNSIDLTYPEITISGNAVNIADGDATADTADNTEFRNVAYGNVTTKTFTIQNTGTAGLVISGISFTGTNAADFSLLGAPVFPMNIAANNAQSITVRFSPGAIGARNAILNIASNDNDEAAYDFALHGTGICNTLPVDTVTGGGAICSGSTGLPVGLNLSSTGIDYQLYNGSTATGAPVQGTGTALALGTHTDAGTYTVIGTDATTNCTQTMAGSAVVIVNPLPTADTVTGGGAYCSGGTGVTVGVLIGRTGISYQLYNGITPVGFSLPGSGSPLDFGLQTTAGTYMVTATDVMTLCTNTMTGTATVSINSLPTVIATSGNTTCAGTTSSVSVTPSAGAGIKWYDLATGGTLLVSSGVLNIINPSSTATYYSEAYDLTTGCISNTRTGTTLTVNMLPVIFNTTGGGAYCYNGAGSEVTLTGSETGVAYQLHNGTTLVGAPVAGTGFPISLGFQTLAAGYTVSAANTTTGCYAAMNGTSTVSINALPASFTVTGGGAYCAGGTGVNVGLTGSVVGINYQLYNGLTAVGTALPGTGAALGFGLQTIAGAYTVIASNAVTGCSSNMTSSASVAINPLPATYAITGGGAYCAGGTGVTVGAAASNSGINYQLFANAIPLGLPVAGTGSALNFGLQTTPGTYTVTGTDIASGCSIVMNNSVAVTANPLPVAFTVTGGGSYCAGSAGTLVGLSGSEINIDYQLFNGLTMAGSLVAGTGAAVDFGLHPMGSYTVVANNGLTGCKNTMVANAVVTTNPLPATYTVTGGGAYCAGGTGIAIGLANSELNTDYQLYNGSTMVGAALSGTGSAISHGMQTAAGIYTIKATNTLTGCQQVMTGVAGVVINPVLTAAVALSALPGEAVCDGTSVTYTASAVNGGTTPSYQWLINGVVVTGSLPSYTFVPAHGNTVTVRLTSSETCAAKPVVADTIAMAVINNETPTLAISKTPANAVCLGTPVKFTSAATFGGTSPVYTWYLNGVKVGSSKTYSYTPANGDVVYAEMASNYRCLTTTTAAHSETVSTVVTEPLIPAVTIDLKPGSNGALEAIATQTVAPTYQWYNGSKVIIGATTSVLTSNNFADNDSVTCVVTNTDACGLATFNSVFIHSDVTGIRSVGAGIDIAVMPNPNRGIFTLAGNINSSYDTEVTLELANMLGQVVYSSKILSQNGRVNTQVQLNNSVANGMYTLNIISGNERKAFHIVVAQ